MPGYVSLVVPRIHDTLIDPLAGDRGADEIGREANARCLFAKVPENQPGGGRWHPEWQHTQQQGHQLLHQLYPGDDAGGTSKGYYQQ